MKLAFWKLISLAILLFTVTLFSQDVETITAGSKSFQDVLASLTAPWTSGGFGGELVIWSDDEGFHCTDDKFTGRIDFFNAFYEDAVTLAYVYLPHPYSFSTDSYGRTYFPIECNEAYQSTHDFVYWMCTDFENRKDNPRQVLLSQLASCFKELSKSCLKSIKSQMAKESFSRHPEWLKILFASYMAQNGFAPAAREVYCGIVANDKALMGDRCVAAKHWMNTADPNSKPKRWAEISTFLNTNCAKCSRPYPP